MKGTFCASPGLYTTHLMFLPTIKKWSFVSCEKKKSTQHNGSSSSSKYMWDRYETYEDVRNYFLFSISYIIKKLRIKRNRVTYHIEWNSYQRLYEERRIMLIMRNQQPTVKIYNNHDLAMSCIDAGLSASLTTHVTVMCFPSNCRDPAAQGSLQN